MRTKKASPVVYVIIIVIAFLVVFTAFSLLKKEGAGIEKLDYDSGYTKCTSICTATVGADMTTLHLCREKCKTDLLARVEEKIKDNIS